MATTEAPLFAFGVIADAQYADLPHGDTEGRQQASAAGCQAPEAASPANGRMLVCSIMLVLNQLLVLLLLLQRYREVPGKLRQALQALRVHEPRLTAVLHLGDVSWGGS